MQQLYPFKKALILLLVGFFIRTTGAMMKIMHWNFALELLLAGTVLMGVAIIWLIIQLIHVKKKGS